MLYYMLSNTPQLIKILTWRRLGANSGYLLLWQHNCEHYFILGQYNCAQYFILEQYMYNFTVVQL